MDYSEKWIPLDAADIIKINTWINVLQKRKKVNVIITFVLFASLFFSRDFMILVFLIFIFSIVNVSIINEKIEALQKDIELNKKLILEGKVKKTIEIGDDDDERIYYHIGHHLIEQNEDIAFEKQYEGNILEVHYTYNTGKELFRVLKN